MNTPPGSAIQRKGFGQAQPLTVALHKLVRDYPFSVGLFKEFIQNADDAGASEVRFILDWRNHPTGQLPHPDLKVLSGPSLLIWNDAKFQAADIENICRLGNSDKAEVASKIGRFGLGFNCCYNVTDHPLLLTGESLFLFDPHKSAQDYSATDLPGCQWGLGYLWSSASDLLAPFSALGLDPNSAHFNATAFRLPLRTVEVASASKIRNEPCSPEMIRGLIDDFATLAPSVLLFLKSVTSVKFEEIRRDSSAAVSLLCVTTGNCDEVSSSRRRIFSLLDGQFDSVLNRLAATSAQELRTAYEHSVTVRHLDVPQVFQWAVSSGLFRGANDRLLDQARNMWRRAEKAIPLAGAAALIPTGSADLSKVSGEVFCFLPLPDVRGGATLPVHINGFFDVTSSRTGLTHEVGATGTIESLRSEWNQCLISDGVTLSYCDLLAFILQKQPEIDPNRFYEFWLDPAVAMPDPLKALVPTFYEGCVGHPLLRSVSGAWVNHRQLRQVDSSIRAPLIADRFKGISDPEIPSHIHKGFLSIKKPVPKLLPAEVRAFYRVEKDPACDLAAVQRPGLVKKEWLSALTRFALKDFKEQKSEDVSKVFSGLPFLLTADGKLHALGLQPGPAFLASNEQRDIFASQQDWFVDDEHALGSEMAEMQSLRVLRMSAAHVVLNLKAVSAPATNQPFRYWSAGAECSPNGTWLIKVLKYLCDQPAPWAPDPAAMRSCCLIPDQFDRLWPCGLKSTPLAPTQSPNVSLFEGLQAFKIGLVHGSSELLAQLEVLRRRFPNSLVWPLSPVDLLDALAGSAPTFNASESKPTNAQCEAVLEYLSSSEALEAYVKKPTTSLTAVKQLAIFPTQIGELVSLTAQPCYLPGSVQGPAVRFEIKLLKKGAWGGFLKAVAIEELTARALIERVLLPGYAKLGTTEQLTVMSWIRDHFDLALTEAGNEKQALHALLQNAQTIRASDGELHAGSSLYFPEEPLVKEVMGEKAIFPAMDSYNTDQDRWLTFFGRLGMSRSPRAQDLADYICFLLKKHAEGSAYESIASKLTLVLQHLVDHWSSLETATIRHQGAVVGLREFLRNQAWCPPMRGQNNLRHLLVADEPAQHFYQLAQLSPPSLGHLVGGILPLLPIKQRDFIPDGIRKLVPEAVTPSVEQVASHFGKILDLVSSANPPDERGLRTPLRSIYSYFGDLLGPESPAEPLVDEEPSEFVEQSADVGPAIQKVRQLLANRACIFVPIEKRFRPAHEVYRKNIPCLSPWRTYADFKDTRADKGLVALGRKKEPSFQDVCSLTVQIHNESTGPLSEQNAAKFLHILGLLDQVWPNHSGSAEFFVLDKAGRTVLPSCLYFNDADWLPENLDLSKIPLAHPKLPLSLVKRTGMRLFSERLKRTPAGAWQHSVDPAFVEICARSQKLLRSIEFKRGLQRIIKKHQLVAPVPNFDWLERVSITAMASIHCDYNLLGDDSELSIGEIEDDIFWTREGGQPLCIFLAEPVRNLVCLKLAEVIRHELQLQSLEDRYLITILDRQPHEIEALLDRLRLAKLDEPPTQSANAEADGEASDFFDEGESSSTETAAPENAASAEAEEDTESTENKKAGADAQDSDERGDESKTDDGDDEENQPSANSAPTAGHGNGSGGHTNGRTGRGQSGESEPGWERFHDGHRHQGQNRGGQRSESSNDYERHGRKRENVPRGRVLSYVLTDKQAEDAAARRDPSNDELSEHKQLGDAAVGWVLQYERQQGRDPEAQVHNNPGFDVFSIGGGQKRPRYIEVKGIKGGWGLDGVPLSVRQFDFAREKGDQFWLYVVEFADTPEEVTIHTIQNPISHITQFRFDKGWQQLATEEKAFDLVLPLAGMQLRYRQPQGAIREGTIKTVTPEGERFKLQVVWSGGHHGMVWFDPLTVELLPLQDNGEP